MKNGFETKPLQYSLRTMILSMAVFCAILGLVGMLYTTVEKTRNSIAREYAVSEVTEMISLYYHTHGGVFPNQWDEMRDVYKIVDEGYSVGPDGIEQLKREIWVNFDLLADDDRLKRLEDTSEGLPTAVFIRRRDDRDSIEFTRAEKWANKRIKQLVQHKFNKNRGKKAGLK